jgi:hypothetical protein
MAQSKRRADGRPLTPTERARYAAHFAPDVLDAARVIDGRVPFWLRPDMLGVTLGPRIYLRAGAYDPGSARGVELLAHELVHVRQYRDGMTVWRYLWASRRGYRRNPYETEAYAVAAQLIASTERASASATSMPSTPADMMPPA